MADTGPDPREHRGQGIIEYGILLGTLAGVVLTLVAIGTQIRTVMTDTPRRRSEIPMDPPRSPAFIVEDHPLTPSSSRRGCGSGMTPTKCTGGREALAALSAEFDLVVLDIMMPEIDGYEVLERIRSSPATASLPVIFLSAKSSPADVEKGFSLGANHYITKPFSGQDLVRKIRLCLSEHAAAHPSA